MADNWQCSFCGTFTTLNTGDRSYGASDLNERSKHGSLRSVVVSTACPNPQCRELALSISVVKLLKEDPRRIERQLLMKHLWPEANVMVLPDYIPEGIRKTYREACLVAPVSGAASAALSRRCLQGVVRDFFKIPANRRGELGAELNFVKDQIDAQIWKDIQAVRAVGDIGAHMDKNVDVIVDVEPTEASLLLKLIEELFKGWYIERQRREDLSGDLNALLGIKRGEQRTAKQSISQAAQTGLPSPADADIGPSMEEIDEVDAETGDLSEQPILPR